jgi:hypothetical protein
MVFWGISLRGATGAFAAPLAPADQQIARKTMLVAKKRQKALSVMVK